MTAALIVLAALTGLPFVQAQGPDAAYQVALDRIREARETGATELDLDDIGLEELPPEIGQLTSLQWLDLRDNALASLSPEIGQLTNLQELILSNAVTILPPDVLEQDMPAILEYLSEQSDTEGAE